MVQQYLDDLTIILPGHSNIICSLNSSKVGYQIKVYIRPKNERTYKERTRWRACTSSRQRLYRVPPNTSGGGGVACPNQSAAKGGCQGRGPISASTLCTRGGVRSWLRHWLESECGPSPSPYRNRWRGLRSLVGFHGSRSVWRRRRNPLHLGSPSLSL